MAKRNRKHAEVKEIKTTDRCAGCSLSLAFVHHVQTATTTEGPFCSAQCAKVVQARIGGVVLNDRAEPVWPPKEVA